MRRLVVKPTIRVQCEKPLSRAGVSIKFVTHATVQNRGADHSHRRALFEVALLFPFPQNSQHPEYR